LEKKTTTKKKKTITTILILNMINLHILLIKNNFLILLLKFYSVSVNALVLIFGSIYAYFIRNFNRTFTEVK